MPDPVNDARSRLESALAGQYRIERVLGRGGMAVVYLAEDLKHRRRVAIKVFDSAVTADGGARRFLQEIQVTAQIDHPHILPLLDSGEAAGHLLYVTPYVEGGSLRDRLERERPLPLDDAIAIAREVADALAFAHGRGIVHRDIKPENILLASGHARVADFGIAQAVGSEGETRMTRAGFAVGTPLYMSPEQASGASIDGRSDVYSLGCVLFEMITGHAPMSGELPASVPAWLGSVLKRALAKSATERFQRAEQFAEALAHRQAPAKAATAIAVLPLDNLSAGGPHAYFAGGLHEELLTQLSKVAALRVISRRSVMGYAGTSTPIRQIARELSVGSVVEGSIQVLGERLRVNVQLIDAETDQHRWAESYDRTLDDAFAIQTEIAHRIVDAVGAVLDESEGRLIASEPTTSPAAYRLYLQGVQHHRHPGFLRHEYEQGQHFYEQALALDPGFALAHAALSEVHGAMHWWLYDPGPKRVAQQFASAETALRLAPDLPEAHIAMGLAHYWGHGDYAGALREYDIALKGMPSNALVWARIGRVHRRLGNWSRFRTSMERAIELDPRDAGILMDLGLTLVQMREYGDAHAVLDRALAIEPDLYEAELWKARARIVAAGDLEPLRRLLDRLPEDAEFSGDNGSALYQRSLLLLWSRKPEELIARLEGRPDLVFRSQRGFLPAALFVAWAERMLGRDAREPFTAALKLLEHESADPRVHVPRGLAFAGLGRREEALAQAREIESSILYRIDAIDGPDVAEQRARILAQLGEADAALEEIERLLAKPSMLSVATLRLDPLWDPIRDHPRFPR